MRDYLLRIKCSTTYIIFLGLFDDLFITVRWNIDRHFEKEKTLFGFLSRRRKSIIICVEQNR